VITVVVIVLIAVVGMLIFMQPTPKSALTPTGDETAPATERATEPTRSESPAPEQTTPANPQPVNPTPLSGPPQLANQPSGTTRQDRPAQLPLVVNPSRFDYGYVLVGETKQEQIVVDNPSDVSITVADLLTACPCTIAEISSRTIGPRQSAVLTLTYTAQSFPHVAPLRSVRILTREYPNEVAQIIFEAAVGREIRVNSDREPAISQQRGELLLESYDQQPFSVLMVDGQAPDFVDFDPSTEAPRSSYLVRYDLTTRPDGSVPRQIHILTDRESDPMTEIPTRFSPNFRESLQAQPLSWLAENPMIQVGTLSPESPSVQRTVLMQRTPDVDESEMVAEARPAIGRSIIGGSSDRTVDSPSAVDVRIVSIEQDPKRARNRLVTLEFTLRDQTPEGLHHDIVTLILPDGSYSELDAAVHVTGTD
jgi:hypothetical protein